MNIFNHLGFVPFRRSLTIEGGDPNSSSGGTVDDHTGPKDVPVTTTEDKVVKAKNLADSIKDAMEKSAGKLDVEPEVKLKPEVKAEVKDVVKDVVKDKSDAEELTKEEIASFKTLKGLLSDPKTAKETLDLLYKQAGITPASVETKKEIVAAKKTILETLKEGLPEEFTFLADILAPSLEKVIKGTIDEEVKDLKEYKTKNEVKEIENDIRSSVVAAFDEFSNSKDVEDEVYSLMDSFKQSGKMSNKEYFDSLLTLAFNRKNITPVKKGVVTEVKKDNDKITRNRTDASSRLASERETEVKQGTSPTKKMNIDEAVKDAVAQATKAFNS